MKHLTQSMIGMLARCAAQFERVYVNGERIPPGIAARRGSGVHEAIRLNNSHKLHASYDLPVDVLQDAARDEYVRLVKGEGVFIPKEDIAQKDKLLNSGLQAAIRLTGLYHAEVAPLIKPVMVEERLEFDVGLPLVISGGIDCYTANGVLEDFKTSDNAKNQSMADKSIQLTLYSALIYHQRGEWPKKCALEVLVNSKTARHQCFETHRGPEDFSQLLVRLEVMIAQIFSGIFPPCSPDSWVCSERWCGFYQTCRYASYRRV